jgi:hypothetical protein
MTERNSQSSEVAEMSATRGSEPEVVTFGAAKQAWAQGTDEERTAPTHIMDLIRRMTVCDCRTCPDRFTAREEYRTLSITLSPHTFAGFQLLAAMAISTDYTGDLFTLMHRLSWAGIDSQTSNEGGDMDGVLE